MAPRFTRYSHGNTKKPLTDDDLPNACDYRASSPQAITKRAQTPLNEAQPSQNNPHGGERKQTVSRPRSLMFTQGNNPIVRPYALVKGN